MNYSGNYSDLLSICIPTYNRDYLIQKCLQRICPIAQKYGVRIYVSDNASPDQTESVIRELQQQYDNLVYIRQEETIAPDDNFEFILKTPDTRYRWLLADGTYFYDESLSFLLSELESQEWDLYIAAYDERDLTEAPVIYTDPEKLLQECGWKLTWISHLIFHQKIIENGNFQRFRNSHFIHTGVIFEYFAFHGCRVKTDRRVQTNVFEEPKRGHWQHVVFDIFCKDWFLFVFSLPVRYSWEAKRQCAKMHGKRSKIFTYQNLIHLRHHHYWNTKTLSRYRFFIQQTIEIPFFVLWILSAFFPVYYLFYRFYVIFFQYIIGRGILHPVKTINHLLNKNSSQAMRWKDIK